MKSKGEVRIPAGVIIWRHELSTASVLAAAGCVVEFLAVTHGNSKSPDILMNGVKWEIKSPVAQRLPAIERNLKRAYSQSANIVFDSRRMGRLPDQSIQRELVKQFVLTKDIKQILFINRKAKIIDISDLAK